MITDWEKGYDASEDYRISLANELAWFSTLDNRYRCEVHRVKPYKGILKIYDHQDSDKEIYSNPVTISYDALFGPDVADIQDWSDEVVNFIDNTYKAP